MRASDLAEEEKCIDDELDAITQHFESTKAARDSMQTSISDLQLCITRLQEECNYIEQIKAQVDQARNAQTTAALEQEMHAKSIQRSIDGLHAQIDLQRKSLSHKQATNKIILDDLDTRITSERDRSTKLVVEIAALQSKQKSLSRSIQNGQNQIGEKKAEYQRLIQLKTKLESENFETRAAEIETRNSEIREANSRLRERIQEMITEDSALGSRLADAQKTSRDIKTRLEELESTCDEKTNHLIALREMEEKYRVKINSSEQTRKDLIKKIQIL